MAGFSLRRARFITLTILVLILLGALFVLRPMINENRQKSLLESAFSAPLKPPERPLQVYHLGHSLVGRDMPYMLQQMAGQGHGYASQLGWGVSLRDHWEPERPVNGFVEENDHPRFRPAVDAIQSGAYDVLILTEMVELRDAIRYHDSPTYTALWADLARAASPETQVYMYETWHRLDDPDGWLQRLDSDFEELWQMKVLAPGISRSGNDRALRMIPAGQVMAAFVRRVEAQGGVGNVSDRTALFRRNEDGTQDMIHLSDLGNYLVALTHYAVLYQRAPIDLPRQLLRADGSMAIAPTQNAADLMQTTVWDVVSSLPQTGIGS